MVISPDEDQQWQPGEKHTIQWKIIGKVSKVNISVVKKKQYHKLSIANKIDNYSSFEWEIPKNIVPSVSYQIKIENSDNPKDFSYSEYFSIRSLK